LVPVLRQTRTRQRDDGRLTAHVTNLLRRLRPSKYGHLQIHQNEGIAIGLPLNSLHRFPSVANHVHVKAVAIQHASHDALVDNVVLRHQHFYTLVLFDLGRRFLFALGMHDQRVGRRRLERVGEREVGEVLRRGQHAVRKGAAELIGVLATGSTGDAAATTNTIMG